MKLLLFLFTSSLLVSSVMSCLVIKGDCPCGNILDLAYNRDGMIYTEKGGCIRNMTCPVADLTRVVSDMESSEIPVPFDPSYKKFYFLTDPTSSGPVGEFVDIFSCFGMTCEDKTWFVTKYPTGVFYQDNGYKTIGGPNEYNGKKSMIWLYSCFD